MIAYTVAYLTALASLAHDNAFWICFSEVIEDIGQSIPARSAPSRSREIHPLSCLGPHDQPSVRSEAM